MMHKVDLALEFTPTKNCLPKTKTTHLVLTRPGGLSAARLGMLTKYINVIRDEETIIQWG